MRSFTRTSLVVGLALGFAFAATPAVAADPSYGELVVINPTGGTADDDGLKIEIASSQIQVTRAGRTQFYGVLPPDPRYLNAMYNYFEVSYTDGQGVDHTIGAYNGNPSWDSGTASASLTADGKSGTVVSTLTGLAGDDVVTLEITFSYTYPNQYLSIATELSLPDGWSYPTRVHWNADTTLGGEDDGAQFEGVLDSGQLVRGVISPDGTQVEAFRQVSGQNLFSWAGYLDCPWGPWACGLSRHSWVANNEDAPDEISVNDPGVIIDNGFGVSVPAVSAGGTHTAAWDVLFVGCDAESDTLDCLNAAFPPEPEDTDPPAPPTGDELANTGSTDVAMLGVLALGALMLGAVAASDAARRHRVAQGFGDH